MPCPPVTTVNHSITAGETHVQTSFTNFTGTPRAPSSFRGCVRRAIAAFAQFVPNVCSLGARSAAQRLGDSFMISGMILLVVVTGIVASAIAGMLNDRRRLP